MTERPTSRRLRILAFDPSLMTRLETAAINEITVEVPWEDLEPGPIGEYIFWMANRARLGNLQATGPANFDLLLGVDVDARTAALVVGYGLEQYLTEDDLERVLLPATGAFHSGDFAGGIRICIELLTEKMKSLVVASEQGQQVVSAPDPVS